MRNVLLSISLVALGASAGAALAGGDGFYNVRYQGVGFSLTQIGGHGELVVEADGFGDLAYGTCTVNFTRDEAGAVKEMTPVVQAYSANCPKSFAFTFADVNEDGLAKISFTEGGPLAGETFELFPVLLPMGDKFKVASPKGFDVLGMTIGQTREEVEAILNAEGFAPIPAHIDKASYTDGTSQLHEVWGKGRNKYDSGPEDAINLTYTRVGPQTGPERVALIGREWEIPASNQLSSANLKKSLIEKHGPLFEGYSLGLYYDRDGNPVPEAYTSVCDKNIHLQSVIVTSRTPGMASQDEVSAACGAQLRVMLGESYEVKGMAYSLNVTLYKGDVAYENFWDTWSAEEGKALENRYQMQAGMTGEAPKL